jgi:2-polyprenyl-3-methyl-5-hydroxy-6-metoxy-1,4-benzoquinol methylase
MPQALSSPHGDYDDYADAYDVFTARREGGDMAGDTFGIVEPLLTLLGDITGLALLDAGCGDGYLTRILAARGATATGVDISPNMIEIARRKGPPDITYQVMNLSGPSAAGEETFDVVTSFLVLNDVRDYRGFIATCAAALKPGGRTVHALNNPYGAVIRRHVANYFDSGAVSPYGGLWQAGIKVYHHHRTLEEYLDAFIGHGMRLTKLADLSKHVTFREQDPSSFLPEGYRFPRFMLLAFEKPAS